MDGTAGPIRHLIDEGDVLYCVWPDAIKPHGIDYGVLKGSELFEKGSGQVVVLLREPVVPCQSRDQALRIRTMCAALIFIEIINPIIPCGTMTAAWRCLRRSVVQHCGSITSRGIGGRHLLRNK